MEVAYSVGVSNRFASLMADEDDPGDNIMAPVSPTEKVEKDKKKKDAKGSKQKAKESKDKGQQARKSTQDTAKRELKLAGATARGGKHNSCSGGSPRVIAIGL